MGSLLWHEIRTRIGAIIGWAIGLSVFTCIYTVFYPSLPTEMVSLDFSQIELYQMMGNITLGSFEGYIASTVFNFLTLIGAIYAVTAGTGTLAGEEDAGTLELLAALPLSRWQIALAKGLALAVIQAAILALTGLALIATYLSLRSQITSEVTASDLFRMTMGNWPILFTYASLSMLLGALMPNRRLAAIVATVTVVGGYFGNNLIAMGGEVDGLVISPFYYYESSAEALLNGGSVGQALILLLASAVLLGLTTLAFSRRDLTVGAWPWQRRSGPHQVEDQPSPAPSGD